MVCMTINHASIAEQKKSGVAGKFGSKRSTAPTATLSAGGARVSPESVRTADFAADIIMERVARKEYHKNIRVTGIDDDGHTHVEWEEHGTYLGGHAYDARARVDQHGNVVGMEHRSVGYDTWHPQDPYGDELAATQIAINRERLRLMGVASPRTDGDLGYSGHKFTGGRVIDGQIPDAADVAKETRKQIKEAIKYGVLPEEYDYRVHISRASMVQAVDITVEGMSDADHFVERNHGIGYAQGPRAKVVEAALKRIVNQWNEDDSDSSRDYFSVNYYSHVRIEDEHTTRWAAEQRELARQKRLAKKAAAPAA